MSIDLIHNMKKSLFELSVYRLLSQRRFLISSTFYEKSDKMSINQMLEKYLK